MESRFARWTFGRWILDRYLGKNNPAGDLAGDIKDDDQFPNSADFTVVASYLMSQAPCQDCWEVFLATWKKYTRWLVKEWA